MEAKSITILNKLSRKDSLTGLDVWYKSILHDIPYKIEKVSNVENNAVSVGQTYVILIPFTDRYINYNEWKNNPDKGFTFSQGDYIFINSEVDEDITPNNIAKIKTSYEPNVCEIRSIQEVASKCGAKYQFSITGV